MEWIDAERGTGAVISDSFFDPFGSIAGNQLNAFPLLRRQFLEEAFKYFLAESFGCPDHAVGLMIDYDGDVLVPLLVGSLIDSDLDQAVKSVFA